MRFVQRKSGLIYFICFIAINFASKVSYDGNQIWRLAVSDESEMEALADMFRNYRFDLWKINKNSLEFMVPQSFVQKMTKLWKESDINFEVTIEDVGKLIKSEKNLRNEARDGFTFDQYHNLEEIFSYLDDLEASNDLVTSEEIGRTWEGREIRLMKVSTAVSNSTNLKASIWFDCGIHAREWISPATCLWGLDHLTSQYGVDDDVTNLLDNHDVYILPVLNVDGYQYTWSHDRLWRKNRRLYAGEECVGVDLNRNYDDGHWGGIGSSNRSCINIYHGPSPFSELETSAVRQKITSLLQEGSVKAFFSVHSYGQLWLFAFGWTYELPPESDQLYRASGSGVDAIFSFSGQNYTNGPHFTTIYPATGISVDWGYSVGIVHSYIVELRDEGEYGFLLPEDQIIPTASEAWTGFVAAIKEI